jgi:2'-5' RNA ligase
MRLFIALNFSNEVKSQINEVLNEVKSNSIQGRFVKEEHMHLTVEFLGEVENDRLDLIKEIMDGLNFKAFSLKANKIGHFISREGKIYWLGIEDNDLLFDLHEKLHNGLKDKGFEPQDRKYKPHITIGRKVKLYDSFNTDKLNDNIGKIKINISKVDLMKSEFIDGKLKYSVMYSKQLKVK